MSVHPYRLGFAVKVLGAGGLKSSDTRRWQNEPHLSHSLELLDAVFDHLERSDIRMYRMSSGTVPYGTHPDLPQFDYRRQIDACAAELERLGARARALGLRLSTHPGQYTVLNAPDPELVRKSSLDLEQDALLLDTLGLGPEAVVVVHVGGAYGDKARRARPVGAGLRGASRNGLGRGSWSRTTNGSSTSATCSSSIAGRACAGSSTSITTG